MENIKLLQRLKPRKQVRLEFMLASTAIIAITSLLAYNRITYEFPLAVGNTGQSALGPQTSAGVGIVFAMVVVAGILGFGATLSIFGSLRTMSSRITDVVRVSLPIGSNDPATKKDEWEQVSAESNRKTSDEDILNALWRSKDKKSADAE